MRALCLLGMWVGCTGATPAPDFSRFDATTDPPAGSTASAPVDDEWEYKVSLALLDSYASYEAKARAAGAPVRVKKCRTVQFFDTPDRSLRTAGKVVRQRVKREARGTCLLGAALAEVDEVDLTYKGVSDSFAGREATAVVHAERETDWIAGATGERTRYSWKFKQELDAEGDRMAALLVALGPATAKTVVPVCASPAHQLTFDTGAYEVTVWVHEGTVIAAEASFDGAAGEQAKAEGLRAQLASTFGVADKPTSKTSALFTRCAPG